MLCARRWALGGLFSGGSWGVLLGDFWGPRTKQLLITRQRAATQKKAFKFVGEQTKGWYQNSKSGTAAVPWVDVGGFRETPSNAGFILGALEALAPLAACSQQAFLVLHAELDS